MENKGQASAEYLLLMVVILIIMAAVTIPMVGTSVNSTMDVSRSSDTKNAVQSIANAVNLVYANGPGAKRTISVYVPLTMAMQGNNSQVIGMSVPLSGNETKFVSATVNYNVNFSDGTYNQGWHTVTVTWPVGKDTNGKSLPISIDHQIQ